MNGVLKLMNVELLIFEEEVVLKFDDNDEWKVDKLNDKFDESKLKYIIDDIFIDLKCDIMLEEFNDESFKVLDKFDLIINEM